MSPFCLLLLLLPCIAGLDDQQLDSHLTTLEQHVDPLRTLTTFREALDLEEHHDWKTSTGTFDRSNPVPEALVPTRSFPGEDPTMHCQSQLSDFSLAVSNFMGCVTNNSRPLRICTRCIEHTKRVGGARDAMKEKKLLLTSNGGEETSCLDALSGQDRLSVVNEIYELAVGPKSLWKKGICSRCFTDETLGTPNPNVTKFFQMNDDLRLCYEPYLNNKRYQADSYNRSEACDVCGKQYNDLRILMRDYSEFVTKTHRGQGYFVPCVDMEDMWNQTTNLWREEFLCFPDRTNKYFPLVAGLIALFIFLVNYHEAFCPVWRHQREDNEAEVLRREKLFQYNLDKVSPENDLAEGVARYVAERAAERKKAKKENKKVK